MDSSSTTFWTVLVPIADCLVSCFITTIFYSLFSANNVDPDQPRSAASDLGLHCLPFILLGVLRLNLVNQQRALLLSSQNPMLWVFM